MGTVRFEAVLEPRGPAAAIVLTDEQVEQLAPGRRTFPVKVTINRTTVPLRLARMGDENLVGFSKAKRTEAGVEIGATYRVVIEADTADRTVDVPDDFAAALQAAGATKHFAALAYSYRKEHVRRINEAKKPETRARRIADSVAKVQGSTSMAYTVDFKDVSTVGLESSPVADALAGLRANEARYLKNKYDHDFTVEPASKAKKTIAWVDKILQERDLVIASPPLEATAFEAGGIRFAYVFYENGLGINVMYTIEDSGKRAVGFKLSEGMDVPAELADTFKFARQKSKLAGTIRGSYFVIKGEY